MSKVTTFIYMIVFMFAAPAWSDAKKGIEQPFIIIFGDSLSDGAVLGDRKGNNNWVKAEGRTEQTGLGAPITNWPNDKPSTWVNFMTEGLFPGENAMGLLSQSPEKLSNVKVLNAAFASAETGDNFVNDKSAKAYAPVEGQCTNYGDFGQYSCVPGAIKQIELASKKVPDWKMKIAAVALWAGANDILNNVGKLRSIFGENLDKSDVFTKELEKLELKNGNWTESSFNQFFKDLAGDQYDTLHFSNPIKNTRKAVDILVHDKKVPVDNILVIGLPDMGKFPATAVSPAISTLLTLLSQGYNSLLQYVTLRSDIKKGLSFVDISAWQQRQTKDPAWVQDALKRNCVSEKQQELCMAGSMRSSIKKPYLFFNDKHPTVATHKKMWEEIKRQVESANSQSIFTRLIKNASLSQ